MNKTQTFSVKKYLAYYIILSPLLLFLIPALEQVPQKSLLYAAAIFMSFYPIFLFVAFNLLYQGRSKNQEYDENSGQGEYSKTPQQIKKWNWAAASAPLIWGGYHNLTLAFLRLIPGLNIVLFFILGVKGNEWAWRSREWTSSESFLKSQKKWRRWGVFFFSLKLILVIILTLLIIDQYRTKVRMTKEQVRIEMEEIKNSYQDQPIFSTIEFSEDRWKKHISEQLGFSIDYEDEIDHEWSVGNTHSFHSLGKKSKMMLFIEEAISPELSFSTRLRLSKGEAETTSQGELTFKDHSGFFANTLRTKVWKGQRCKEGWTECKDFEEELVYEGRMLSFYIDKSNFKPFFLSFSEDSDLKTMYHIYYEQLFSDDFDEDNYNRLIDSFEFIE